jgi:hypothetical protein
LYWHSHARAAAAAGLFESPPSSIFSLSSLSSSIHNAERRASLPMAATAAAWALLTSLGTSRTVEGMIYLSASLSLVAATAHREKEDEVRNFCRRGEGGEYSSGEIIVVVGGRGDSAP